jgi:hypothetical protein
LLPPPLLLLQPHARSTGSIRITEVEAVEKRMKTSSLDPGLDLGLDVPNHLPPRRVWMREQRGYWRRKAAQSSSCWQRQ